MLAKSCFRRSRILRIIGILSVFFVLSVLSGCGDSEPAAAPEPASIGETITTDKVEIIITSGETKKVVGSEFLPSKPADGGIYYAVQWQYKNISDKPIESFKVPRLKLVDGNNTEYESDIGASASYATELKLSAKILSDINPGITIKDAHVFEVSEELFNTEDWKLLVDSDEDIYVKLN
jgi:hypothetical protein